MSKVEPLTMVTKVKDPAILASIDMGNNDEIKKVFQSLSEEAGAARVYRTGFKGMNEMTDGGLHGVETSMHLGLPHKYKSGLNLTLFSQVLRYNFLRPKTSPRSLAWCVSPLKMRCPIRSSSSSCR